MKSIFSIIIVLFTGLNYSSAQLNHTGRGMYVDKFFKTGMTTAGNEIVDPNSSVLGIPAKEDSVLMYAKNNHITYLILYDLHRVFGNGTYENYLCSFIQKAKTQYGIEKIGMASSCAAMFDNVAIVEPTPAFYFANPNNSTFQQTFNFLQQQYHPGDSLFYISEAIKMNLNATIFNDNCSSKIDVMVTEYEFWNTGTDNCLDDNVTKDQKYDRFQQMVVYMDSIRDQYNVSHPGQSMYVETYLGFLNQNTVYTHQNIANWIDGSYNGKRRVDRINLHYYAGDATKMYSRTATGWNMTGYYQTRFFDFCQSTTNNNTNILPIFSSEYVPWGAGGSFLGSWFYQSVNNNIFTAEKYFYNDWYDDAHNYNPTTVGSATLGNVVNPGQALWFASYYMRGHLDNPVMFTSNSPVCVSTGQNGSFQFQYQGPIEQGLSFKFYITDAGSSTLRCGTTNTIPWPAYNGITQTSIDLNAAISSCSLPVGDYDAHLILNYTAGYSYTAPLVRVSVVTTGKIVALTSTTVCQGNPVYLKASSTGGGTTAYAWYNGNTAISGATSSEYAPNPATTGLQNYSCLITSSIGGCSANKSNVIPVTINSYPTASITLQSATGCTSVLHANPASASYIWQDGSTSTNYTATLSGNYSVAVTTNGCTSLASYLNHNVNLEKVSQTNSCPGSSTGNIKVNLFWGTSPYSLSYSGPVSGNFSGLAPGNKLIDNLPAGTYTIVVTDASGCSKTLSPSPVLSSFPAFNISTTSTGVTCGGSTNGSASVTNVSGGAGGPYSYFWSYNNSSASSLTGIPSGNYTVEVSDAAGCTSTSTINVPVLNGTVVPTVSISASPNRTICFGETVVFTAAYTNGGTPDFQWKKNGNNVGLNSSSFSDQSLQNNDNVNCTMTSHATCPSPAVVNSNTITISVWPNSIFYNDNNVCTIDGCNTLTGVFHNPVNVNDNNPCTIDGCNSFSGIFHTPTVEICGNNLDDDCDGLIDEGCNVTLSLKVFIQGFYKGSGIMAATINALLYPTTCDTITVELHQVNSPYNMVQRVSNIITTTGTGSFVFPYSTTGQSYYIVVKHRNALETWSSSPVLFSFPTVNYDFSNLSSKAYSNNQADLNDGRFALWSGDVSSGSSCGFQDGVISLNDQSCINNSTNQFLVGYLANDLTGDGMVESADLSLIENNLLRSVAKP